MRNLEKYPITTDEIVECLDTLIAGMLHLPNGEDVSFGDMRPLLLAKAKEIVLANASAQCALWHPIDTIPQDRPIDGWHKVWKCPVTIAYRSWGDRNAWVEKTLTTEWPLEAFTHWRETSEAPSLTSTERK